MKIFICICLFLLLLFVTDLLVSISKLMDEKRNYQIIINKRETQRGSEYDTVTRLNLTVSLLNLCNVLIENEIAKTIKACTTLGVKYDLKRLDVDVATIAQNVFKYLKPELMISGDLVLTDECIMHYISDETVIRFLNVVKEYNTSLRQM